jgi:glycosyltransferase involved in cell wall biosynthesis
MRIAQLAPLIECVPPKGYGGTELVVSLLTEQLIKNGHEVTLFASGDSVTEAQLVSVVPEALRKRKDIPLHRWAAYDLRSLLKLMEMCCEFDVIHNHMGFSALPMLSTLDVPMLSTNHNHIADYCSDVYLTYKHLPFISISNAYKKFNYPEEINYTDVIYNGIDVEKFSYDPNLERHYLLFIGRISADKGTAVAIDMAEKLGLPLKIAGKVDVVDENYFNAEIKPHLNKKNIEYLGEVTFHEKVSLYKGAKAVLYPINFEEPFGLVMAESLACGTPVVALDRGSVREVVSDGQTGIVAQSVDELLCRFAEVDQISGDDCQRRVINLFSKEQMACNYENVYKRLIRQPEFTSASSDGFC